MNHIKWTIILILVSAAAYFAYFNFIGEDVKVTDQTWKIIDGQYQVSFNVENKRRTQIETDLLIKLYQRNFAGGSPKAEILSLVGEKRLALSLNPSESRTLNETVKPKMLAVNIDKLSINSVVH